MAEIWELGLAQIANVIASRTLSSVEVVDHYLARIDAIDPKVHSYVHIDQDSVRADARAADAELQRGHLMGPLHGVPVAIKDIIDIAGQPTTNGSRLHLDNVASEDAFVISQLRSAGAIMLGKLDTHEFAIGGPDFSLPFPPARNPWDLSRFTGGSSSGSGAAVAAGLAPLALGTDTGGSVRTPSAYCGLAGMKPTYGAVSRHGITQQAYSMETSGPLTWTVRDNALALQAMIGFDPRDAASVAQVSTHYGAALDLGVHGLRIGLVRNFHEDEPDSFTDEIVGAFEHAAAILQSAGAELHEIRLSPLSQYFATQRVLMYGEAAAFHENDLMNRKDLYGPYAIERLLPGFFLSAADYVQATRRRGLLSRELATVFQSVDLLLVVGAVGAAPAIDGIDPMAILHGTISANAPFSMSGSPAMIVPTGFNPDGLPLAVQVVGRHFEEATVYRAAQIIETAVANRHIRPEIAQHPSREPMQLLSRS